MKSEVSVTGLLLLNADRRRREPQVSQERWVCAERQGAVPGAHRWGVHILDCGSTIWTTWERLLGDFPIRVAFADCSGGRTRMRHASTERTVEDSRGGHPVGRHADLR